MPPVLPQDLKLRCLYKTLDLQGRLIERGGQNSSINFPFASFCTAMNKKYVLSESMGRVFFMKVCLYN
ncbi:hypothetical protein OIU77_026768 [Salix suchowensis]|uniref:Uncharacterized protein n=1 Tax=Salix suchowensis TaxID=1278906 RepID=A0ABQ9BM81_9ROSI|nr:hypothetical protein OIU77_026768 [Salix suchowensis]